jgi:hypothetical protein
MDRADAAIFVIFAGLFYVITAASLVPWTARQKGRSGLAWMLIALLFSPLLALIALAAVPVRPEEREKEQPADADVIPYKWQKGAD